MRPPRHKNATDGVIFVLASCFFDSTGFAMSFAGDLTDGLRLVEQAPTGIIQNHVAYYTACWTNGITLSDAPPQITVSDAGGSHELAVRRWAESSH